MRVKKSAYLLIIISVIIILLEGKISENLISNKVAKRTIIYTRTSAPIGWTKISRATPSNRIDIKIAIKQQNLDKLEKIFWDVHDPNSPNQQKFMEISEIDDLIKPDEQLQHNIINWLHINNVKVTNQQSDAIDCIDMTVELAEMLFETKFYIYLHTNGNMIIRSFGAYSIPSQLIASIDLIEGVTDFPMLKPISSKKSSSPVYVIPQTLQALQQMKGEDISSSIKQGPAEFQDDSSYNPADLKAFFTQTDLKDQTVSKKIGPYSGTYPDTEATLDTQYMLGVTGGAVNYQWTSKAWMQTFSNNIFNYANPPDVISISWGWSESQQCGPSGIVEPKCKTLGINNTQYINRVNTEFQKVGLRGISLFVSSGDSGANGRTDGACTDKTLHAAFPSSSPYVTSVGANQFKTSTIGFTDVPICKQYACAIGGLEEAVSQSKAGFTSGGGFSLYSKRPSQQDDVVNTQLTSGVKLPPTSQFPKDGRATPDVSAMGNNFLIYVDGSWMPVGGTSASSPTWAAVGTRLNSISMKLTGKKLGFLNPLLQKIYHDDPTAFHDITEGDNKCTEDGCASTCEGFEAAKGWDPVTGLGSPNTAKLESHITKILERNMNKNESL